MDAEISVFCNEREIGTQRGPPEFLLFGLHSQSLKRLVWQGVGLVITSQLALARFWFSMVHGEDFPRPRSMSANRCCSLGVSNSTVNGC